VSAASGAKVRDTPARHAAGCGIDGIIRSTSIEEGHMAGKPGRDPKEESLRATRTLNPRPGAVADGAFAGGGFFDPRDLAQVKYEMVRKAEREGAAVTRAAADFGLSRQSFYQARAALGRDGLAGLVPARPGPRGGHKLTAEVVAFAEQARREDPAARAKDLADLIEGRFGVRVHPRSVERALAKSSKSRGGR
jgi:transposase